MSGRNSISSPLSRIRAYAYIRSERRLRKEAASAPETSFLLLFSLSSPGFIHSTHPPTQRGICPVPLW